MVKTLRLVCACGRNLADVRLPMAPRRWPHDDVRDVEVVTRRGVTGGLMKLHLGAGVSVRTYSWHCGCKREHRRTHDKLLAAYQGERHRPEQTVKVILDRDL